MNADDALSLFSEEQPSQWLQYRDGSWAPVWSDGLVGKAFTIAELLQVAHEDDLAAFEDSGLIIQVIDVEPFEVADTEADGNDPERR